MTISEANAYAASVAIAARKQRAYQSARADRIGDAIAYGRPLSYADRAYLNNTSRDGTRTRAARQTSRDLRAARTIRTLKGKI